MTLVRLVKKELLSIKRSLKLVMFILVFPVIVIVFTPVHTFSTSLVSKELSIVFLMFFPYLYSITLISDSILKERAQGTLDVLLTSPIKYSTILKSKILPIPLLGMISQVLQLVALLIAQRYYNVRILPEHYIQIGMISPFLAYKLALVAIVLATKFNFEKTGEQILLVIIALLSGGLLTLLIATNVLNSFLTTGILVVCMYVSNRILTHLSVRLTKYVKYT